MGTGFCFSGCQCMKVFDACFSPQGIRANKFQVKIHAISCQVPLRVVFDADVIDTELAMHNIFAVRVAS